MAYIGKAPNTAIVNQATSQSFSGNGSTTAFTLTRSVNVSEDLEVFVNNVQQEPGSGKSYTASGTTLTFDEAPPSGTNNVYVIYRGEATINPRLEHDANAALSATTGTFSGDLTVDTDTLKVDSSNNRVGIGTSAPAHNVEIVATAAGSVNDSLQIRNNATSSGTGSRIRFINSTDNTSDANGASISSVRNGDDNDLVFETENATRMTIDHAGHVGIGTSSPTLDSTLAGLSVSSNSTLLHIHDSDGACFKLSDPASGANRGLGIALQGTSAVISNCESGELRFGTGNTERMQLDGSGNLLIGTTTSSTATEPGVVITSNAQPGLFINNSTTSSGVSLILLRASHSTADETKFEVTAAGNVKSRTNSYGSFSDERLKEQIVDASSQWDDIKAIEVKNFKFISDLDDADNPKMIGVLAQQVESVSPALVEDDADGMKTVKYSILYMKAVKALQEAMTRIETLEAKVAALEGN